jgi:hypothetical protein
MQQTAQPDIGQPVVITPIVGTQCRLRDMRGLNQRPTSIHHRPDRGANRDHHRQRTRIRLDGVVNTFGQPTQRRLDRRKVDRDQRPHACVVNGPDQRGHRRAPRGQRGRVGQVPQQFLSRQRRRRTGRGARPDRDTHESAAFQRDAERGRASGQVDG